MAYLIYGTLTYTTNANRNTALTNINNALAGYTVTPVETAFPAGINTSGSTGITVSIQVEDADVESAREALRNAWTSAARATTGHHISTVRI